MVTTPQPTASQVREELDRLLEDAAFRRAPSHSRLLRYLVERKTAGDDGALCEAGIAMAVFQRDPAAYDAEIDPIVRVSIGRLRDRLEKHYQHFERMPETIVTLPKGRYAPEYRHRPASATVKCAASTTATCPRHCWGRCRDLCVVGQAIVLERRHGNARRAQSRRTSSAGTTA